MRQWISGLILGAVLFSGAASAAVDLPAAEPPECGMAKVFDQTDTDAPSKMTAVWGAPDGASLMFVEQLNVNTDGTRRSYNVNDFWGASSAINNLCNAMKGYCAELTSAGKTQRKLDTQAAYAAGWPKAALTKTRISASVIVMKGGKPCPSTTGYLVSATALTKAHITDVCDQANYVDALTVPALVLPLSSKGFKRFNAKIGDLVVVMAPGSSTPIFGVVGDSGPADKLGEASVAMAGQLNGLTRDPINYKDVRAHWQVARAIVLIFPATRDTAEPYMTNARIQAATAPRFADWGGTARLKACLGAY